VTPGVRPDAGAQPVSPYQGPANTRSTFQPVQPTENAPPIRTQPQTQQPAIQEQPAFAVAMYCPNPMCRAGNPAGRHFCIRCGQPLVVAAPVRIPWWQRFFPRRDTPQAGDRPARTGTETTFGSLVRTFILTMLVVVLAGGLLAYAVAPAFRQAVNLRLDQGGTAVRRLISSPSDYAAVRPSSTQGTSDIPGHPVQFATDLVNNDYWAADTQRDPEPTLVISFDGKTNLDALVITSGAAADFARVGRPKTIQITYSDGTSDELTLNDDPKAEAYPVYARGITSMTMKITSIYPASGSTAVALTEVEFQRLK
jgi:hypothetical protein